LTTKCRDDDQDPFIQACFQRSVAYGVRSDFPLYVTGDRTYPANRSDDGGNHFLGLRFPLDGGGSHFVGAGFEWIVNESVANYRLAAPEFAVGSGDVGGTARIGVSIVF
jgi:hypothetical protein